ncbi:MAG: UDP-N-acetylglucosamine 2-epimerase (hydrolyzing) [Selenomonas ruminantium]|jgi:UDP-N-acetylglucosamine 2-epimerase (non-hydrolysing)|uniref:UDP-N-acetylglucosamine 2-epimerase (Hydrolyzing) n=1 Tax=Selenomonas ruminantium TaxID=971 RepID=A0A927WNR7_SELRU|nr:UDP-N-acetylglucosamine 2-epimerase [Selenomonas ruminantium]MBE6085645.1 UDP-N-acetylglucosamine 2-epimerase (hydrolyzing) [Selenomonas ruminantium]
MDKYKVVFATGSRADYGIVRNYLRCLDEDNRIDLSILVTGALLSSKFGHQVELIYRDGFKIAKEIDIELDSSSNKSVTHSMAVALDKFGAFFYDNQPDLLIILGDRYEMLSVATAAAMNRITILHIHGGELTYGNYDEFIRHSITKMSMFHFTATEEYRQRVIQLGENPERVFNLGALGAENCLHIDETMVPQEIRQLIGKKYFVVLFHPETLTNVSVESQIDEVLKAIDKYKNYKFVFLGVNADTYSDFIRLKVKDYVSSNKNCSYFENLPTDGYHYLVKHSIALLGNSSSGLIEAPSLETYTINIGDRQAGRARGNSVIDVNCNEVAINNAMDRVVLRNRAERIFNPYYQMDSVRNYYDNTVIILKTIRNNSYKYKRFYDLY